MPQHTLYNYSFRFVAEIQTNGVGTEVGLTPGMVGNRSPSGAQRQSIRTATLGRQLFGVSHNTVARVTRMLLGI